MESKDRSMNNYRTLTINPGSDVSSQRMKEDMMLIPPQQAGTTNNTTTTTTRGRSIQRSSIPASSCFISPSLPPSGQVISSRSRSESVHNPYTREDSFLNSTTTRRRRLKKTTATTTSSSSSGGRYHSSSIGNDKRIRPLRNRSLGRRYRSYTPLPRSFQSITPRHISSNSSTFVRQVIPTEAAHSHIAPSHALLVPGIRSCNTTPLPTAPPVPLSHGGGSKYATLRIYEEFDGYYINYKFVIIIIVYIFVCVFVMW